MEHGVLNSYVYLCSNIREFDEKEIQQVAGGYIPIGPTFSVMGFGLQGLSQALKAAGYSNLANSFNLGSYVFNGFGLFSGGW